MIDGFDRLGFLALKHLGLKPENKTKVVLPINKFFGIVVYKVLTEF
jgi:hypothetical protein